MLFIPIILLLSTLLQNSIQQFRIPFELDTEISTITCRKCVQLWTADPNSDNNPLSCGVHSETCTGNACFMRSFFNFAFLSQHENLKTFTILGQCKRCGIYQYISGCVRLTDWQMRDLQISRQKVELLNTRAGASMLCEDNANHVRKIIFLPLKNHS